MGSLASHEFVTFVRGERDQPAERVVLTFAGWRRYTASVWRFDAKTDNLIREEQRYRKSTRAIRQPQRAGMVESGAGVPAEWFCEQQPERRLILMCRRVCREPPVSGAEHRSRYPTMTRLARARRGAVFRLARVNGSNSGGTTKATELLVPTVGWEAFFVGIFWAMSPRRAR